MKFNCCVAKCQDLELKDCIYTYILFTSGCVTRSDRHGHLKDTSEENSRRKVSQDLCNVEVILKLKYTVVPSVQ